MNLILVQSKRLAIKISSKCWYGDTKEVKLTILR